MSYLYNNLTLVIEHDVERGLHVLGVEIEGAFIPFTAVKDGFVKERKQLAAKLAGAAAAAAPPAPQAPPPTV